MREKLSASHKNVLLFQTYHQYIYKYVYEHIFVLHSMGMLYHSASKLRQTGGVICQLLYCLL